MPIEGGDRRWLVAFSDAKPLEEAYYERLFAYLDGDGPAAVKDWLLKRSVALNPKGMAPATRGKATMRQLSMGEQSSSSPRDSKKVSRRSLSSCFFEDVMKAVPPEILRRT